MTEQQNERLGRVLQWLLVGVMVALVWAGVNVKLAALIGGLTVLYALVTKGLFRKALAAPPRPVRGSAAQWLARLPEGRLFANERVRDAEGGAALRWLVTRWWWTLVLAGGGAAGLLVGWWLDRAPLPLLNTPRGGPLAGGIMILLGVPIFPIGIWLARHAVRRRLRVRLVALGVPVCVPCGYDLRGSPGPACPECGAAFDVTLLGATATEQASEGEGQAVGNRLKTG